jgi:hypothetical protein
MARASLLPLSDLDIMAEQNPHNGIFSMGNNTMAVPLELFAENRWVIF